MFLKGYAEKWLINENVGQDSLIADITLEDEVEKEVAPKPVTEEEEGEEVAKKPDPLAQLIQCFQRAATSEHKTGIAITEDELFIEYEDVMAKSIHVEEEEEGGGDDEGEAKSPAVNFFINFIFISILQIFYQYFNKIDYILKIPNYL